MVTKIVKYKGFDGEDIEEVVRFNLTKAEIMNLNNKYAAQGGLINYLRKILTDVKDDETYMTPFITVIQTLLLAAYGEKTDDGKFIKKRNGCALADEFESSEAYSQLLMDLISDEGSKEIDSLILGMFPADMVDQSTFSDRKAQLQNALKS